MNRIRFHRYGGTKEMRLESCDAGFPDKDEVLVKVHAASVNPFDWKVRSGALKIVTGKKFPKAMGSDFSGTVERIGSSVTAFQPGDDVFGTAPVNAGGAFGEVVVTKAKLLAKKPKVVSFELAATLPIPAVTAYIGLVEKAKVKPGTTVFVHGCLGGVGRSVVQLAKALNAKVSGSCRGSVAEEAHALGLEQVVDFTRIDVAALGRRFDVVFDTVGSLSSDQVKQLLRSGGISLDTEVTPGKLLRSLVSRRFKPVIFSGSTERLEKVASYAAAGTLKPKIGKMVRLLDAVPAMIELENNHLPKGKLVITMT